MLIYSWHINASTVHRWGQVSLISQSRNPSQMRPGIPAISKELLWLL